MTKEVLDIAVGKVRLLILAFALDHERDTRADCLFIDLVCRSRTSLTKSSDPLSRTAPNGLATENVSASKVNLPSLAPTPPQPVQEALARLKVHLEREGLQEDLEAR
jgi:hypothetical protein